MTQAASDVDHLLACLALEAGLALALDASGQCTLALESGVEVTIAHDEPTDTLSLRATLTPPGQAAATEMLAAALAHNYGRLPAGYAIALDIVTGRLVLLVLLDAGNRSPQRFLQAMAELAALAPHVSMSLSDSTRH